MTAAGTAGPTVRPNSNSLASVSAGLGLLYYVLVASSIHTWQVAVAQLAPLLGLSDLGLTVDDGYLLVNTTSAPGAGIVGQTMQFHGTSDRYSLNGATSVAGLLALVWLTMR